MSSLSNQHHIGCIIQVLLSEFFKQKVFSQDVLFIQGVYAAVGITGITISFVYHSWDDATSENNTRHILKHFKDHGDYFNIEICIPEHDREFACRTVLDYACAYIEYTMIRKLGVVPIVSYGGSVLEMVKGRDILDFRIINIGRSNFQWA
jgi:hypothetical protein